MATLLLILVLASTGVAASGSSLYQPGDYRALVGDHRAVGIGDSVVVLVYESAVATNQTNVTVSKSTNIAASANDRHNTVGGGLETDNDANGSGIERRSGAVVARVSATVVGLAANGDYLIEGRQRIALNNEAQFISVAGRVRPADIDTDNTVLSTRIADAQIEFIGEGLLSDRGRPGYITRFFNWLF